MAKSVTCYFAYGSNLKKSQMAARIGRVPPSKIARLTDFRLAFNTNDPALGEVYANVIPTKGSEVWGVVYECHPPDMVKLDKYEDVAAGHYRRGHIVVEIRDKEHIIAETYMACEGRLCPEDSPSRDYALRILSGAIEHGLPAAYIRYLEDLTVKR